MSAEDARTARMPPQMDSPKEHDVDSPSAEVLEDVRPDSAPAEKRPFHAKRRHRKSRAGCTHCKARKVKCDEARPQCRACRMRRETCVYGETADQQPWEKQLQVQSVPQTQGPPAQPLPRPPGFDLVDMRLLWYYTVEGYSSFTTGARHAGEVGEVLQVRLPRQAFANRFLMDCLLALSAAELQARGQGPEFGLTSTRVLAYRTRAFGSYRAALVAQPASSVSPASPALLACSLLLCALSTHMFRDEGARPLCLADWMAVWRGIGLVIQLVTPRALPATGVLQLFVRPPVDLDAGARHVPNALLFMVSTIRPDEPDYAHVGAYYRTLQFLGSLFRELRVASGMSETLILRTVTWATFVPPVFVALARARRPRALVILAHYLVFVKLCRQPWWMQGIADKEIGDIAGVLRDQLAWQPLLRVPLAASETEDTAAVARLLLDNQDCMLDSSETDSTSSHYAMVDNTGCILEYRDRWLQVDTGRPAVWHAFPFVSNTETAGSSPSTIYSSLETET